jgi:hypothetical protein
VSEQLAPLIAHPGFQSGDQWRATFLTNRQSLLGRQPVDPALDIEQRVNPLDRFQGNRREDRRFAALGPPSRTGLDIDEDEELAPRVGPQAASWIGFVCRSASYSLP